MPRPNRQYCLNCEKDVDSYVTRKKETYRVKGEAIGIETDVRVCSVCDQSLFDKALDGASLEKAYAIYRKKHGLLGPAEIKEIRERYGLSQIGFAKLLNWGEVTIHRYENGSIPDASHNLVLKFLQNPRNMRKVLARGGSAFPKQGNTFDQTWRMDELTESPPISPTKGEVPKSASNFADISYQSLGTDAPDSPQETRPDGKPEPLSLAVAA